ncbi:MAG: hypothetical protein JWN76_3656, partial [Chitinophagaceae bacterium]|nr:hypothetical protein [Chitinophagaceae bacterium]
MSDQIFDQFVKDKLHDHVAPVPGDMWQRIHVRTDQVFDQFIKNKLDDHEAPVPDDMWQRIQRHTDDDRRGFLIPRLGVLLILLGLLSAGGFYYYTQFNNKNSNNNKNTLQPLTGSVENAKQEKAAKDQNNSAADSQQKLNTDNNSNNSIADKNQAAPLTALVTARAGENTPSVPGTLYRNNNFVSNHPKTFASNDAISRNSNTGNPTADLISEVQNNKAALQTGNPQESQQVYIPLTSGSVMSKNGQWNMLALKDYLNKYGLPIITCPSVNGLRRSDLYVEGYVSPDFVQKVITGPASFLQRKDSTEIEQLSFTAGMRLSKSITDHILLKTGLQYSQINETYHERTENERRQVTIITTHTISRPNGDTVIIDTSQFLQIGYRTKTTHNKYRRVDVPVLLSYEIGKGSLKVAATGGVILNVYSFNKGEIVDTAAGGTIKTASIYKNNVGMSAYAGLSIIKSVSEKMDVFAEPYFKYDLSNNANTNAVFTQKFNTVGVNIGVRYL